MNTIMNHEVWGGFNTWVNTIVGTITPRIYISIGSCYQIKNVSDIILI